MNGEPESIISFAIKRSIEHNPDQAAGEMLKLIRANASLEEELFFIRNNLLHLALRRELADGG